MVIRDALMKSIRPRIEELAEDLVDLIATRFEGQLEQALDAARSALASDLVVTVSRSEVLAEVNHDPSPRKPAASRSTPGVTPPRSDLPAQIDTALPRCSKCGFNGHNARTCKREPSTTKPATTVAAAPTQRSTPAPASSPSPKPDRFAAIEEAARRREEKNKRGPRDPDDDDRPMRVDEPELAADVGLPAPTFSTDF